MHKYFHNALLRPFHRVVPGYDIAQPDEDNGKYPDFCSQKGHRVLTKLFESLSLITLHSIEARKRNKYKKNSTGELQWY
ncbi:hypothetical protein HUJ05_008595 [Dendroctonus ponderosae]|nr:hypothetical protein HUJ05_008595 [Dendroctonus ponderosae]